MNYQCSNEFILALRDLAMICEENNSDNLRLSFDISDDKELCVYISFEVKENDDEEEYTNADRIRSMSDEELAELLTDEKFATNVANEFCLHKCKHRDLGGCKLEDDACPYTVKDDVILFLRSKVEG